MLSGFTTIWVVIGLGMLLAQLRVMDTAGEFVLNKLSFTLGMPALMFVTLSHADVARIFSKNVIVALASVIISGGLYLVLARIRWHPHAGHSVIGAFCSCYVNANNMGLPIAAYVMKDTSWVAPILLMQQGFLQPIGLSVLDLLETRHSGRTASWISNATVPLRNPMTIGVLSGLVVNLAGFRVPQLAESTLSMLGGLAVPCMLIAYGISLRCGPKLQMRHSSETITVSAIKLFVQPFVALAFCLLLGVNRETALAAVVMAGLPTAQNVFVFSSRYATAEGFARDVILVTTICSIATIAGFAALVHVIW